MNTAQQLYEVSKALPEPVLAELLDFAVFLSQKQVRTSVALSEASLSELEGGLESSVTFVGNPIDLQERLRDEWRWGVKGVRPLFSAFLCFSLLTPFLFSSFFV